ncbi:MAG: hypothetical protein U1F77_07525 [Kiritimatiellia bacterium]
MKEAIIAVILLAAIGSWVVFRARAQTPKPSDQAPTPKKNPAEAGWELRRLMLAAPPTKIGVAPTKDFPRVYGILMDWPLDGETLTVFSTCTGTASLYTTFSFGVIGGEFHDAVQAAAKNFVRAADHHFDAATPTTDYPYPAADRVRFYLLTFDGVRVIDTDLVSVSNGSGKYAEFFMLGQAVLTELRLITEKPK